MKNTLLSLLILVSPHLFSQITNTALVKFQEHNFYHISNSSNTKLLVFLHGGVINPAFDNPNEIPEISYLLEGNQVFITSATTNGFDVLIPVTDDSLNWLSNHQYCFQTIKEYIATTKSYDSRFISGFSDGGTGSFKIFYDNKRYFGGLVVFNGFPQNQNFQQSVSYDNLENTKIAFFSTFNDKQIEYEFLIIEYSKQKPLNANTYLHISEGGHSFKEYGPSEMDICFNILTSKVNNLETEAIQAYIENDSIIEFYTFRKKIYKKYLFGKKCFEENMAQEKLYQKK